MVSPALTVPWSATLVIVTLAQLTMIGIGPTEGLPSLVVVTEAELLTVPQVAEVVGEVMWTWKEAPEARSTGPKLRFPAVSVQLPVVWRPSMLQLSPAVVGTVSETVTPVPVPGPELLIVTTYPMVSPALTVPWPPPFA